MAKTAAKLKLAEPLKLDLGCGKNKKEGFTGVDARQFDGKVDIVHDLRKTWPWKSGTVDEVHCSHFVEHLTGPERIHFVNELYRVLKEGAKALVIVPHWASQRAYGDLTHQWPPVSEFWFYYLDEKWRSENAPHNDFYQCDFNVTWGYGVHPEIQPRNQEFQMESLKWKKDAATDIIATLLKR